MSQRLWLLGATCVGTQPYMAPEVWLGRPEFASDQYALAVTYVGLRRGRLPFTAANRGQMKRAHLRQEPNLTEFSAEERQVLDRALSKNPRSRYTSCQAFVRALQGAFGPLEQPGGAELSSTSTA